MININQALTQPILLWGAERLPLVMLVLIDLFFIIVMEVSPESIVSAGIIFLTGLHILRKIGEYDPLFFEILRRRYLPEVTPKNLPAHPSLIKPPSE